MKRVITAAALSLGVIASAEAQNESNPGLWEGPYQLVDVSPVHAATLPTGQLILFKPTSLVWDPASRSVITRPVTSTNLYCSGHATMADGRVLAAGGTQKVNGVALVLHGVLPPEHQFRPGAGRLREHDQHRNSRCQHLQSPSHPYFVGNARRQLGSARH